jgi:hypothetical protein
LFWKRKFEPEVIVTCVRWYLRFCLSLRDLEELMAERGLSVDHTTIWRWTQTYGPQVCQRLHGELKRKSSTWHMDETFVWIAGKWMYLFRALDSQGQTVDFYLSETRDRSESRLLQHGKSPEIRPRYRRHGQLLWWTLPGGAVSGSGGLVGGIAADPAGLGHGIQSASGASIGAVAPQLAHIRAERSWRYWAKARAQTQENPPRPEPGGRTG